MKYMVSLSGGKDSTAMLLMLLEKSYPIDEIIFCDTGMEFDEMYKHLDKLERFIEMPITRLKSEKSFEYYLYQHKKKSKKNLNLGYGFPRMRTNRWCTSKLKQDIFNRYIKEKYNNVVQRYIGIALDEIKRCKNYIYPLVEFGVTERDALKYCYEKGFDWNGLYNIFNRVSCWCCPLQSLSELKKLYKYYPKKWELLKIWEKKTYNNFRCDYNLVQLEQRFKREVYLEDNQISMFG